MVSMRDKPGPLPGLVRRFEDERLITGQGRYIADLAPPDALSAWFVRSPFARGDLAGVDVSMALDMPGVVAIYTAADLDLPEVPSQHPAVPITMARPMLARDRVTFVGEPVALVIAESAAEAEDAAGMVFLEVDPTDAVVTLDDALRDEVIVHPEAGTNVAFQQHSTYGSELPAGLTEVSVTVENPRLAPSPIETLTMLVTPADGDLHVYLGSQSPHEQQRDLAQWLGMEPDRVRVIVPDVGGAFGMKRFYPEYVVIAKAALLLDRPVLWAQHRRDIFLSGTHGRGLRHEVTLSADAAGKIHGARFRLLADTGAYPHRGVMIPIFSRLVATGLYDIPHVDFEIIALTTNLPPTAPYRGAGRPEAALAIERAVDALARELDLDPAELRRRNFISELPHETPTGAKLDSGDYAAALEKALRVVDYDGFRAEQAERRDTGGPPLGIGIGAFIERSGGAPDSWEYGDVEVTGEGRVVVRTGSTSTGQGHDTVWRRVAAEVFDVAPADVDFEFGDTALVGDSVGSFSSRSAQAGASAVWRCAERVRVAATELAAEMLEAAPEDIQVSEGAFHVAGSAEERVTLAEVAELAAARGVELRSDEKYSPGAQTFPYGVYVAIVEVDVATGLVTLQSLVAVDDVGTVVDEMMAVGQIHGSAMQGMAAALLEKMHYDELGQPQAATFVDYLVPSALQMPPLHTDHIVHPAPSNPLGAKGAGESGCIGVPPAVLNGAIDALGPLGVKDLQIPLTPQNVWNAIQEAAR